MCQFFSCLVTKNKILWDKDIDSHEELITKFKLKDNTNNPSFVRIEIIPLSYKEADIKALDTWKFKVDQDYLPDWFNTKEAEISIRKILPKIIKELFIFKGKKIIKEGRIFACDSATVEAFGSATVKAYGSATVEAYNSATVEAYNSATVKAYCSATVKAYDSATVEAYNSATVEAYYSATVKAYNSATVKAYGSATVEAYNSATVEAYNSATVEAYNSATVMAYGSTTVEAFDFSNIIKYSGTVKLNDNAKMIDRSK